MEYRSSRFWVILAASAVIWATLVGAGVVHAANSPPLAEAWNITSAGKAESSGELLFRVSGEAGEDPVEVTVFVLSGTNETGVASSIRRALSTQLNGRRYNVTPGEDANVLLSSDGDNRDGFSVELLDSDVENVRVTVQSATPVAPPTVPEQRIPANPPATPATPPGQGDASPPPGPGPASPSAPPASPSAPPASPSSPPANPSAPPEEPSVPGDGTPANDGAGAPASAPPPPASPRS